MSDVITLAVVGGTVLTTNPGGEVTALKANVLISGDRIVQITDEMPVAGISRLDATGLHLIPGMVDLHTHNITPAAMALYLQHGVTSVRFAGTTLGVVAELRRRVDRGEIAGPRIFSCGPHLDEPPTAWPEFTREVAGPADVQVAVGQLKEVEADAIIAIQRIRPETLRVIVEAAHERNIPVTGQIWTTTVREAATIGMDGAENTARLPEVPARDREWIEGYTSIPDRLARLVRLWAESSRASVDETLDLVRERGMTWTPALCSFAYWGGLTDASLTALPSYKNLDQGVVDAIPALRNRVAKDWTDEDRVNGRSAIERMQEHVESFVKNGGALGVGTDAHPGGLFYHLELDYLAKAGLDNGRILHAATVASARALWREKELGVIAPGALADIVAVGGDPRKALTALRDVRHTVVAGRVLVRDGALIGTTTS